MSRAIPTIRAAAAAPMVQWMQRSGLQLHRFGMDGEMALLGQEDPMKAIPLRSLADFLVKVCQVAGPDVPVRMIQETGDISVTMMGPFVLPGRTAISSLNAASRALPYFSSHEHLAIEQRNDSDIVRQFWGTYFDRETLHFLHQYVAGVLELVAAELETPDVPIRSIEMVPHPELGLGYLQDHFNAKLLAGNPVLTARYSPGSLSARWKGAAIEPVDPPEIPAMSTLRGSGGLAGSAKVVLRAMLEVGRPSVEALAQMMGVSKRSFQRRLKAENTSYSELLSEVRNEAAAEWMELDTGHFWIWRWHLDTRTILR